MQLKICIDTHTRLTALFLGLPRWTGTRKVKPTWILLKQETVSGSGISWAICKSASYSTQITTPAPHPSVVYRPDALPAAQCPTDSVKALTYLHWPMNEILAVCFAYFFILFWYNLQKLATYVAAQWTYRSVLMCRPRWLISGRQNVSVVDDSDGHNRCQHIVTNNTVINRLPQDIRRQLTETVNSKCAKLCYWFSSVLLLIRLIFTVNI